MLSTITDNWIGSWIWLYQPKPPVLVIGTLTECISVAKIDEKIACTICTGGRIVEQSFKFNWLSILADVY